ncbi:MAG: flagellar motor switch protein FliN [Burkholderiales bacterium]|nr:flagellar motor switch protein FliN [Burkholderiales bacterium]MDE2076322.1 flagellar motor switch protein FliN [Burkholderiales bacterium]MDE2433253.1 flagellar motor switch protein FliN [Burkholderiales bacterium]HET8693031.1 flagellar motor switch protein FliN [Aquabacterium sp.]
MSDPAEFPPEGSAGADEQDAMAAEWEAALAQQASSSAPEASAGSASQISEQMMPASFANFGPSNATGAGNDINMILDIPVQLTVELGRTRIPIKNILQLAQGSVVELDAMAGEPMDVLVNGFLIAQGEVVVVNDKFGIRLTDIVTPSERMRRLSRGG